MKPPWRKPAVRHCLFHCPDPEMDFDGLIFGWRGDVDPSEFGESDLGSREIDLPRDKVELALVNRCVCENKPILGICRGTSGGEHCSGGNIYQDLSPALLEVHAQTSEGKNRTPSSAPVHHDHAG